MTREDLIKSQEYWMVTIQTELFNHVRLYLEENKMTQTQFAAKMGVSKGYISQIMNGNFNHSLSKLIELSLAIGKMPVLKFDNFETRKEASLNQMPSPSA
jgi:transcriptional regulator with XRE-family HTH domain